MKGFNSRQEWRYGLALAELDRDIRNGLYSFPATEPAVAKVTRTPAPAPKRMVKVGDMLFTTGSVADPRRVIEVNINGKKAIVVIDPVTFQQGGWYFDLAELQADIDAGAPYRFPVVPLTI